jgi:DNA-directed RNA polymerase subunit omega
LIYPEGDALKERVRNRYSLVVLASKRAKQIKEGAPALIDTSSTNSLTIALEEIAAGKVSYSEHQEVAEDDESPSLVADMPDLQALAALDAEEQPDRAESLDAAEEPSATASQAEPFDAAESAPEVEMELSGIQPEPVEEA